MMVDDRVGGPKAIFGQSANLARERRINPECEDLRAMPQLAEGVLYPYRVIRYGISVCDVGQDLVDRCLRTDYALRFFVAKRTPQAFDRILVAPDGRLPTGQGTRKLTAFLPNSSKLRVASLFNRGEE